ncbi:hypothetical protein H0H92_011916, partial [Tricholoma furcatifolium]
MAIAQCPYCCLIKPTLHAMNMHIFRSKACYQKWQDALVVQWEGPHSNPQNETRRPSPLCEADDELDMEVEDVHQPSVEPEGQSSQRAYVEEVEDEGEPTDPHPYERYIHEYPRPAGQWSKHAKTVFERLVESQEKEGKECWAPFAGEEEWELATWLMKHVGQKSTDEYLKLPIVRNAGNLSFQNNYTFLQKVDALPTGPEWACEIVHVEGDRLGKDGEVMSEDLELWMCDPVECIRELMGNPAFSENISYAPERAYRDEACTQRIFDEMWTANWWWDTQASDTYNIR